MVPAQRKLHCRLSWFQIDENSVYFFKFFFDQTFLTQIFCVEKLWKILIFSHRSLPFPFLCAPFALASPPSLVLVDWSTWQAIVQDDEESTYPSCVRSPFCERYLFCRRWWGWGWHPGQRWWQLGWHWAHHCSVALYFQSRFPKLEVCSWPKPCCCSGPLCWWPWPIVLGTLIVSFVTLG